MLKISKNNKYQFFNFLLSILFGTMWIVGADLDQNGIFEFGLYKLILIIGMSILFFPVVTWITRKIEQIQLIKKPPLERKNFMFFFGVITFSWFLGYLAMFPGIYTTDSPFWYYEFANPDVPISSYFSPLYAGLFYLFVESGKVFGGSWDIGFAIFTFLQMSFILYSVYRVLQFINHYLGSIALVICTAFFSILPTHIILSVSSAQDAPFVACFAMYFLHLILLVFDEKTYLSKRKNLLSFLGWAILMCLMRNNGIYILVCLTVIMILFGRKFCKIISLVNITTIFLILLYQGPIFNLFNIKKGTEFYLITGIIQQQMAYVYQNTESLPDEIKEELFHFISEDGLQVYAPKISDNVRTGFKADYTKEHFVDFLKLYCKMGIISSEGYLQATLLQTYALWYPGKIYPDLGTWHPYIDYQSYTDFFHGTDFILGRSSLFPVYDKVLAWLFGKGESPNGDAVYLSMTFSEIPILSLLVKAGTSLWVLLFAIGYALLQRRKAVFCLLFFPLGLYATVFLGPVILYRYVAPVIFSLPLVVATLFLPWEKSEV